MAPKGIARKDAPPPLPSRDHFERAHFAVQVSVYLQQLVPGPVAGPSTSAVPSTNGQEATPGAFPSFSSSSRRSTGHKRKHRRSADAAHPYAALARSVGNIKGWTEHNQVKTDPSLKRAFCSGCNTVLIPGLTARVRIRPSKTHQNTIHHTCLHCGATLALPAPPCVASGPGAWASGGPEAGVEGPVRARRRAAGARPAPFHEWEAPAAGPEDAATCAGVAKGCGSEDGAASRSGTSANDGDGNGNSNDKQKQKGKQKGTATSAAPAGPGHVLWRGTDKAHGWGVEMARAADLPVPAPALAQAPKPKANGKGKGNQQRKAQEQQRAPTPTPADEFDEEEAANNM